MHLSDLLGPDVLEIMREDPAALREALATMHPADVAELVSGLQREDRLRVLTPLEAPHGQTLSYADGQTMKVALIRRNAGSQTVSTIIRALALGQIRLRDGWRVLLRETSSGFLLGTLLCVFAVVRTLLWRSGP